VPFDQSAYNRQYYADNRERLRETQKRWRDSNKEARRESRRRYVQNLKDQVYAVYGRSCTCCGEDNPKLLTIDHVNGGGGEHRRQLGSSVMVLLDIIKRGFPDEFQVLCFNCNLGRSLNGGVCPHEEAVAHFFSAA